MNRQEIFDKVSKHFASQKAPSVDKHGECLYRAPRGRMCAVGCLIADEHYHKQLEGLPVYARETVQALKLSGIDMDEHTTRFLAALQSAHDQAVSMAAEDRMIDNAIFMDVLESNLARVAKGFKLALN